VEFDSDDEDNLILAIQPYDTVTSVGFAHVLQHLPTKFLTRRSDIIVSSTMSITLTPNDDDYKPLNTNEMDLEAITNWVNLRHEYRASKVKQAKLGINDRTSAVESQNITDNQMPQQSSMSITLISQDDEEDEENKNQTPGLARQATVGSSISPYTPNKKKVDKRRLPRGGLSQPLDPNEYLKLDED